MKSKTTLRILTALLLLLNNCSVEASYFTEHTGLDPSARNSDTYIYDSKGNLIAELPEGKKIRFEADDNYTALRRSEFNWLRFPLKRQLEVNISFNQSEYLKRLAAVNLIITPRRRVILNYTPMSSVWHLPMGISQLAPILQQQGHNVLLRYGHIIGLEYVLKQYGGKEIDEALKIIRNPSSNIHDWHKARTTFENVSRNIPTQDKFIVERNNVRYVSVNYDGTIEGVLQAIHERDSNIWYQYFSKVEIPLAINYQPEIYGISLSDEKQLIPSFILASLIKEAISNTLVVLGGNFWSRVKSAFTEPRFAELFKFCDAIVYGEGYQPLVKLADKLKPELAPATVWSDKSGVVKINSLPLIATNFETLPIPEFNGGATQWSPDKVLPIFTMSNCQLACGFCAIAAGSDTYLKRPRTMTPQRIAETMSKLGTHRFDIVDETFPITRQIAVGKELQKIGYKATWQSYLTITNDLLNSQICENLYDAGCRAVQLGLESLSPETLAREKKQWNHPQNYAKILQNLKKVGIQTHVFMLIGIPGEPLYWGLRWVAFLEKYGKDILTVKAGRYRLTKMSPEDQFNTHNKLIEVLPDDKPLHLNRDFRYLFTSRKRVQALRTILEQACRQHWAYPITSTIPWWINRGRYSWQELINMSKMLPEETVTTGFDEALKKINNIVCDELGHKVKIKSYQQLAQLSHSI